MSKLVWRVKLVAEQQPGVTTETELACIERDAQAGLADLGLSFAEAKHLTAALQAEIVPTQVAALGECPRACEPPSLWWTGYATLAACRSAWSGVR